jgi:hypothetical protein
MDEETGRSGNGKGSGKKAALAFLAAVLGGLLIGAVVAGVLALVARRRAPAPRFVSPLHIARIDVGTNEIISLTTAEWAKLGHKGALFKNPNTGKYTMDTIWLDTQTGRSMPYTKSPHFPADVTLEAPD